MIIVYACVASVASCVVFLALMAWLAHRRHRHDTLQIEKSGGFVVVRCGCGWTTTLVDPPDTPEEIAVAAYVAAEEHK